MNAKPLAQMPNHLPIIHARHHDLVSDYAIDGFGISAMPNKYISIAGLIFLTRANQGVPKIKTDNMFHVRPPLMLFLSLSITAIESVLKQHYLIVKELLRH